MADQSLWTNPVERKRLSASATFKPQDSTTGDGLASRRLKLRSLSDRLLF